MKKTICALLLACVCLALAACGASGAAQAAADPTPAAQTEAPAPTPEPTPEPVDLTQIVEELNYVELKQRENGYPFIGAYELSEDGKTIIYKLAMDQFDIITLLALLEDEEGVEAYNATLNEVLPLDAALESAIHDEAPEAGVKIYMMLNRTAGEVAAVIEGGQIVFDAINGIGEEAITVTPILTEEEAAAMASPTPAPAA